LLPRQSARARFREARTSVWRKHPPKRDAEFTQGNNDSNEGSCEAGKQQNGRGDFQRTNRREQGINVITAP